MRSTTLRPLRSIRSALPRPGTFPAVRAAAIVAVVLAGCLLASGCASDAPAVDESLMELSWREFDQTRDGGWRAIADAGDYRLAARTIEAYLERHPEEEEGKRAYMHFHAGQVWAIEHEYEKTLAHYDSAYVTEFPERFPVSWNHMVGAESAFLRGDLAEFERIRTEFSQMTNLAPRDSMFLEYLYELDNYTPETYGDSILPE